VAASVGVVSPAVSQPVGISGCGIFARERCGISARKPMNVSALTIGKP
jgi:hypothetical protein